MRKCIFCARACVVCGFFYYRFYVPNPLIVNVEGNKCTTKNDRQLLCVAHKKNYKYLHWRILRAGWFRRTSDVQFNYYW